MGKIISSQWGEKKLENSKLGVAEVRADMVDVGGARGEDKCGQNNVYEILKELGKIFWK